MKEGIGGTFMIYVMLIFLAVYITFVAVAFNYARAFRVKNKVIDIIEQSEGMDFTDKSGEIGKIESYLANVSYKVNVTSDYCPNYVDNDDNYFNSDRGYCVSRISATSNVDGMTATYYKVTTFIRLEIPFMDLGFTIPVKGETRKIERINS